MSIGERELVRGGGVCGEDRRRVASSLVVEVKERAGVDGDQVREYLDRLGYKSTGQVLPLANQLYRRPWALPAAPWPH